jgi:glyoxylase-like metal-dependent hydrolase (beta-lactamase superfamily II)
MKRALILGSIVAAGLAATAIAQQPPGGGGGPPRGNPLPGIATTAEKVSDNVYKIFGAGGNTTFFIRSDGVTLVDTKLANNGAAILSVVRSVTDKPVTMIINTHSHPDHIGSNQEIDTARGGNVQVVVHANSQKRMATMPTNSKVSQSFADTLTLGSGRDQIKLYYFGPAHTDGDAFVVFPGERVMAAGDVMAWDMGLLVDPASGGSMVATPITVGRAAETIKGVDKVIEGHGNVNTWAGFLRYLAYTRKVIEVARRANAEGLDYVQAYDKYFATDPAMAPYTVDQLKAGLEYGGTPKARSQNNLYIAMLELKGEKPPLIMGAPPRPGEPLPGPRGPGGRPPGAGAPGAGPGAPGGPPPGGASGAPRPPGERG